MKKLEQFRNMAYLLNRNIEYIDINKSWRFEFIKKNEKYFISLIFWMYELQNYKINNNLKRII